MRKAMKLELIATMLREFEIEDIYPREIDIAQHVVVEPKRDSALSAARTPLAYEVVDPADHRRAGAGSQYEWLGSGS
jgi:hypothetical protein